MRAARAHACRQLHAKPTPDAPQAWGWRGRTFSGPVTTVHGPAWLRLHATPADQIVGTFWNGAVDAQRAIPAAIPRPRLLAWHDWTDPPWAYRAELHQYVSAPPIATRAILTSEPDLPPAWWAAVRQALTHVATIATTRVTIHPGFLAWAMPHYLGAAIGDDGSAGWTTAHGDFHYANLCGPDLHILDWEGWGCGPAGYDIATLHSYSLLVPTVAARIRQEFADLLDTETGRATELAVITELLHTAAHGDNHDLAHPLRRRAAHLLGRPVAPVNRPPTSGDTPADSRLPPLQTRE